MFCSLNFPGSVADIDIMSQMKDDHLVALRKEWDENDIVDTCSPGDDFPDHWAALADKGYQGSSEFLRVVHPRKKPQNGVLTMDKESFNRKVPSDCIIVENVFGRM